MFITGGTGFIGSNLVRKLIRDNYEIHLLIKDQNELIIINDIIDKVKCYDYDGSIDCIMDIFSKVKPDIVFHLASLFLADHKTSDIEGLVKSNILLGTQLLEAMHKNNINKLINTGTSWQHYNNSDYSPVCLYAATKQAFETIIQYYVEVSSIKVITLKLFDTYGKNDPRKKLFHLLVSLIDKKEPLYMSPGEQLINLVYIDDVIDAFEKALDLLFSDKVEQHQIYSVSAENIISLKDLVAKFEMVSCKKLPIVWGGRPYRLREVMVPWTNGQNVPGWKPKVILEEGIKKIL